MSFDSEKWALSFCGVVDERFAVETDLLKLHIYRKANIRKIEVNRLLGKLDVFIPDNWDMETYCNQEKLRKIMWTEVKWQALNIYLQRTNQIAQRIGLQYISVSVSAKKCVNGCCYYWENRIGYDLWTICSPKAEFVDYLICHELAHFYIHNHKGPFWRKVEQIYLGLGNDEQCTGEIVHRLVGERSKDHTIFLLRYWGKPSYLKDFFDGGLVRNKTPLITPIYKETPEGKVERGFYTSFEIKL